MKQFRSILVSTLFLATLPLFAASETFRIDKQHSSAEFKIRHMVGNVTGRFTDFAGVVNVDRGNPAASSVEFTIQTASIDTSTPDRDKDLRSSNFFDVDRYPTITFKSTKVTPAKTKDTYDVVGDLTIHGVTKRVTLPVAFLGFVKDPWGNERAGFELNTTLDRKDYGIVWNKALDQGGFVLGDDVKISINLETIKKK
ncbi:MAG TPA: YceI family protein [Thermoanaerobaculia bacterium]|jgi:polyisoprenoid-binding protein YceI|nr:YceI family protein [Thermoanaerobaculia bacterium]